MEKLKIAITLTGTDSTSKELILRACEDTALLELCTPVFSDTAEAEADADALVLVPAAGATPGASQPIHCPADAIEVIVTDKASFMPLTKEPTIEDITKLRDILERDFDIRSPRIAIVQESGMQNPDLATQATTEQGINTYGPYTAEQILAEDIACHFDGIIVAGGTEAARRIVAELTQEAPARFFAGRESVVTAVYSPLRIDTAENELAEVAELTHPIYAAIDIIRNRAFYDEARQNPLPKLFHDRREDRKAEKSEKSEKSDKSDKSDLSDKSDQSE